MAASLSQSPDKSSLPARRPRALPAPARIAAQLRRATSLRPPLAIVLGSGFAEALADLELDRAIPYARLAGFPATTVGGHPGRVLLGRLNGTPVVVLQGRAHFYEGHSLEQVTFPIRVLAELGVETVLLTNASGAIHPRWRVGDFMCLTDHINLLGANPLRGVVADGRTPFVDLTATYDVALQRLLAKAARQTGVTLRAGVYLAVSGPSYETPAEIRAFARLGADAVGMSTVPEAIVARQCGLRVAGLSCLTNLAAGRGARPLAHADVLATARRVRRAAADLLGRFVQLYSAQQAGP